MRSSCFNGFSIYFHPFRVLKGRLNMFAFPSHRARLAFARKTFWYDLLQRNLWGEFFCLSLEVPSEKLKIFSWSFECLTVENQIEITLSCSCFHRFLHSPLGHCQCREGLLQLDLTQALNTLKEIKFNHRRESGVWKCSVRVSCLL